MEFQKAREKYEPEIIKYLFVSEAPPAIESDRYFYFRDVRAKDDLFLNLMMALYPLTYKSYLPVKEIRKSKKTFLDMFMSNGCYLIDSVDEPMPQGLSSGQKTAKIKENRENLLNKINKISSEHTKVILISSTVFAACYDYLKENGVNVANEKGGSIYFPDRWNKDKFHSQMKVLLKRIDWQNIKGKTKKSVTIIKKQ